MPGQFARLYPLGQSDLPVERKQVDFGPLMPPSVRIDNPSRDYTPPGAPPQAWACQAAPALCMAPDLLSYQVWADWAALQPQQRQL